MAESELQGGATGATPVSALPFILPFVLYLAIGTFEPKFQATDVSGPAAQSALSTDDAASQPSGTRFDRATWYTVLVAIKFLAVGSCLFYFFPTYRRCFPLAVDGWGVAAGILGGVLWIGLCGMSLEPKLFAAFGMDPEWLGTRSQFNPFWQIGSSIGQFSFLAARFALLLVIVPLAEEIFLRGFLMRIIQSSTWSRVSLRDLGWPALICGSVYGVVTHPSEAIAALAWFSLVSFLMIRTGKFWNCVLAHAITNGLLGIYVITFHQWQLW